MTEKTPYAPTLNEKEKIFEAILDGVRAGTVSDPARTAQRLIQSLTVLNQSIDPSDSTSTQRQDLP